MERDDVTTVGMNDDASAFDAGAGFEQVVSEGAGAVSAEPEKSAVDESVNKGGPDGSSVATEGEVKPLQGQGTSEAAGEAAGATVDFAEALSKLQKQVDDNKAWGTQLAQENAELKKLIEAGVASPAQDKKRPDAMDDAPPEVLEFLEGDPVAMKAVAYLVERQLSERMGAVKDYGADVSDLKLRLEQVQFERAVTAGTMTGTGYVAGHPDAFQVMGTQDYREWFAVESVKNPAILNVSSPVEAIGVLDRYKEFAAQRAASHSAETTQKADLENMMKGAVPKGSNTAKKAPESKDMTDDEAFDAGMKR